MTEYRRHFVPGGTYFFTVNLAERSQPVGWVKATFAVTHHYLRP